MDAGVLLDAAEKRGLSSGDSQFNSTTALGGPVFPTAPAA
jgi:hypothetical protein